MPTSSPYSVVIEKHGRVLRRVDGFPERAALKILELLDKHAEISGAALDLLGAASAIARAIAPLLPKSSPPRRRVASRRR